MEMRGARWALALQPEGWEHSPVLRSLLVEALWPMLAAVCVRGLSPRVAGHIRNIPPAPVGHAGSDSRAWLGPTLIALFCAQAAIHALLLWTRLTSSDQGALLALAPAIGLLQWLVAMAVASGQLLTYLRSIRHRHYGLFSHGVLAFVVASLCASMVQAYFALFVPSQWRTPIVGRGVSRETLLLQARLALNAAAACVLLTAPRLPRTIAVATPPETPGELERLLGSAADVHYTEPRPRQLSSDPKARRPSPEIGDSILQNALFCWVGDRIALGRKQRQLQLDDLYEPPDRYSLQVSWRRFCSRSRRSGGLATNMAATLMPEILWQLVLNPLCVALEYTQPLLMQCLLRFIGTYNSDPSVGLRYGLFLAFCLLVASLAATAVQQQQDWSARTLLMHNRNILVAMVTQKILRKRARCAGGVGQGAGSDSSLSEGRTYSVLTTDIRRMANMIKVVRAVILVPCQLALGAWYLYRLLGIAGVLGMLMLVIVMSLTRRLISQAKQIEAAAGVLNDRRVTAISEVLQGITSIKLLGLGSRFVGIIGDRRSEQLSMLWQRAQVQALISMVTVGSLPFVSFAAFAVYGLGHGLDAETIFTAIAVFKIIQRSMDMIPTVVANSTSFYVSFRRIEAYLGQPEVQPLESRVDADAEPEALGFDGARLVWSPAGAQQRATTGEAPFVLGSLSMRFPRGQLTVIGGPTGSGKSALLSALIGEMELVQGKILVPTTTAEDNCLGRPASGCVLRDIAYVPQEPWLRNATIRDNILFGEPLDRERYDSVLRMCALGPDLDVLLAGDLTEIGERGITLSGGQRQRVGLARAVYSRRRILLIDDCLSAVDAQTGRHILHSCLLSRGSLMAGRTCLLATHHMAMCLPHSDFVVVMWHGRVAFQGTPGDALADPEKSGIGRLRASPTRDAVDPGSDTSDIPLAARISQRASATTLADEDARERGKIIKDEARQEGLIKLEAWRIYFAPSGGWWFVASCLVCVMTTQALAMYKDYYLAGDLRRTGAHGMGPASRLFAGSAVRTLAVYLGLGILSAAVSSLALLWLYAGSLRSSQSLHSRLLESIVSARLRFLDTTPVGRIMARFTNDMQAADDDIMANMNSAMRSLVALTTTLVVISSMVPLFAVAGVLVLAAYAHFAWQFMHAQRDGRRLEGAAFAPIISLYSEMIPGGDSIRAFGMEAAFMDEMKKRYDVYFSADFTRRSVSRWVRIRIGIVSSLVSFATALLILANISAMSSGLAGFFLIYAISFWAESNVAVVKYTDLEISLSCVERMHQYIDIDHEAPSATAADSMLPPGWPQKGTLEVSGLFAGYTEDVPVLHNLTFAIRHGEKVGVVGRTGAGKSTLAQALLRLIEAAAGRIELDGVDIAGVGLERMRQGVAIVPQEPVLFNGTVRFNLDPLGDHPDTLMLDALMLDALRRTLLLRGPPGGDDSASVAAFGSLDDAVTENGRSLSLGQRQLVALARALVRRSRLVIMDEATASVDFATDAGVQQAIRGAEFADSTLICIAHRLRTVIDYDRIMVLDEGQIVEFDTPARLLRRDGGLFRRMCEASGELALLERLARCQPKSLRP
ncbi:hypothetical protein LPJ61_002673 [Coemansia biformis]|uniref:P-loop containing nucleoside triphosphate hydrolase protein n=1 Tax=Coemansia biformis TaxID=1286918 RepID=A0A9W7YC17_9FUNG|nr:hypothetical protein LPJ61_002673 [Coemansia biformis]